MLSKLRGPSTRSSGRTFMRRQQRYVRDLASPAEFYCDAVKRTSDPTGTIDIRKRFIAMLDTRWRSARGAVQKQVVDADVLGLKPDTVSPLAGPVKFQTWLDNLLKRVVVGDAAWMRVFMQAAYNRAIKRAMRLTQSDVVPKDQTETVNALSVMCLTELQGIAEAVSQRVMRAASNAWLHNQKPRDAFRDMDAAFSAVGKTRSSAMAEFLVVKSFNTATLDQFAAVGVERVGLIPESLRKPRSRLRKDSNENHDPKTGQFTSGPGGERGNERPTDLPMSSKYSQEKGNLGPLVKAVEKAQADGTVQERDVKLSELRATQNYLGGQGGGDPVFEGLEDKPVVVNNGVEKIVLDGHHRVSAAIASGNTKMSVYYINTKRSRAHDAATGPGSRISREEVPSASTIRRIRKMQAQLEEDLGGSVEVLTAGDDLVCMECEDIEAEGPYTIDEARSLIPAHPRCRCAFAPVDEGILSSIFGKVKGFIGKLFGKDEWNEEDHPRAPAGSPEGGQFAGEATASSGNLSNPLSFKTPSAYRAAKEAAARESGLRGQQPPPSGEPKDAAERWKGQGASTREVNIAKKVCEQNGFDPSRVSFVPSIEEHNVSNGLTIRPSAQADLRTGNIRLSLTMPHTRLGGTLSHEIMHQKFDAFAKDPANSDYLTNAIRNPEFARTDGVTPYSKQYWGTVKDGTPVALAYHETLAEMAKQSYKGVPSGAAPVWQDMYDKVNAHWSKR